MSSEKIHFIGGGHMAEAIIRAVTTRNILTSDSLSVTDTEPARLKVLQQKYHVHAADNNAVISAAGLQRSVLTAVRRTRELGERK